MEKLLLILYIKDMDEETLAAKVYKEQKLNSWPGLVEEGRKICEELGIEDVNETTMSKKKFKEIVLEACKQKDEQNLKNLAKEKQKCTRILKENFERKEYIMRYKIEDVRHWFRTRFGLQPFGGNFSKDKRFAKSEWLCKCKEEKETEVHLLEGKCKTYGDINKHYGDLTDDANLVGFFQEVLARRSELEEQEEETMVARRATECTPVPRQEDQPVWGVKTS